jgi:hypothetical protein
VTHTHTHTHTHVLLYHTQVDEATDRPTDPPVILSAEVMWNPFEDIVPRTTPAERRAQAQFACVCTTALGALSVHCTTALDALSVHCTTALGALSVHCTTALGALSVHCTTALDALSVHCTTALGALSVHCTTALDALSVHCTTAPALLMLQYPYCVWYGMTTVTVTIASAVAVVKSCVQGNRARI